MVQLVIETRDGARREIDAESGVPLMEAIRDNGFDELLALCGGCCSCATCHVFIDEARLAVLPPKSEDEDDLLEASRYMSVLSRLSCQIEVSDVMEGCVVTIAPED